MVAARGWPGAHAEYPIAASAPEPAVDLTVLLPAIDEGRNLGILLPRLNSLLAELGVRSEVLLLTHAADAETREAGRLHGARIVEQTAPGYGGALATGFAQASGNYLLTMDADLSHPPHVVEQLWRERDKADVTIASRYVPGGSAEMSGYRYVLSRYAPRNHGSSNARVLRVGLACLRTFGQLWLLRNSILAADYDDRAHDSRIPLQRYWQRSRFAHVMDLIANQGPVLDVGCGSSRIIGDLPAGSVAVDVLQRKLRYARKFGRPLARASGFALPFADASFPCVLCSQVIEHVPKESPILDELCRVLKPGGRLVLGTPDYANWQWVYIEKLYGMVPGGYKDEHISHYTNRELREIMLARGLTFEGERYILQGELIQAFRKTDPLVSA
jgi:SAM-dependent methyltransferase